MRTPFFPTEDTKKEKKITTMAIYTAKWYKRFRDFLKKYQVLTT